MIRRPVRTPTRLALGAAAFAAVIGVYSLLSWRAHRENPRNRTLPNLEQFQKAWAGIAKGRPVDLAEDAWSSGQRLAWGLGSGVAGGFVLGLLMGCFPAVDALAGPPIAAFARVPPTAMLAVYLALLSITSESIFVALIGLGVFPTLTLAIAGAARTDVDEHTVNKAYTLGASTLEVVWNVVLRQILPRMIEAVRLQVGPAMVFLIAAEYAVADSGFGYALRIRSKALDMATVYTYLAILAAFGVVLDFALASLRRWLCPWFRA